MSSKCRWWNAPDKTALFTLSDRFLTAYYVVLIIGVIAGQPSLSHRLYFANSNPQPCPENPIVLAARDTPQYVHSPYTYEKLYPPDCDCKFILMASSANHRIRLVVIDSQLEEPLFGECNDYCAVYDGNSTKASELARWCGSDAPLAISGQSNALFVHFRSDAVVEKRGFNMSFLEYELGNCPPDWMPDKNQIFCYRLYLPIYYIGYTWTEAQSECAHERANLLSFENLNEYEFVYDTYSDSHTAPWIAYNDVSNEGTFANVVPDEPFWPNKLQHFEENEKSDCLYLDWNRREHVGYAVDDCRDRRAFICKKRRDGSTTSVMIAADFVRSGLIRNSGSNRMLLILLLILLLLLLLALFLLAWKLRDQFRRRNVVVGTVDNNQRLTATVMSTDSGSKSAALPDNKKQYKSQRLRVPRLQEAQATLAKVESLQKIQHIEDDKQKLPSNEAQEPRQYKSMIVNDNASEGVRKERVTNDGMEKVYDKYNDEMLSPRISMTPNQPLPSTWEADAENARKAAEQEMNGESQQLSEHQNDTSLVDEVQSVSLAGGIGKPAVLTNCDDIGLEQFTRQKQMDSFGLHREVTGLTTITSNTVGTSNSVGATTISGNRIRARLRRKSFERPHVSALDSVSAISLDEFWHKSSE